MIALYIISTHHGTNYCGITNNLIRRWHEHKKGKSSYLRHKKPIEVVFIQLFETRQQASKNERRIKRFGVTKFMKLQNIKFLNENQNK